MNPHDYPKDWKNEEPKIIQWPSSMGSPVVSNPGAHWYSGTEMAGAASYRAGAVTLEKNTRTFGILEIPMDFPRAAADLYILLQKTQGGPCRAPQAKKGPEFESMSPWSKPSLSPLYPTVSHCLRKTLNELWHWMTLSKSILWQHWLLFPLSYGMLFHDRKFQTFLQQNDFPPYNIAWATAAAPPNVSI